MKVDGGELHEANDRVNYALAALAAKEAKYMADLRDLGQANDTLQRDLAAKEAALGEARRLLRIWHDSDDAIMEKHGVDTDGYIAKLEAKRDTLQAELDCYQTAIRQGLWGDTAPNKPHGKEIFAIRREVVKLHAELARVREALKDLLEQVGSLEGYELTRDVEPYKAQANWNDAICRAQAALQPSRGEQG